MRSVLFGASSGLGRALAEELARAGHDLFLVASDLRDLEAAASDLRLRFDARVACAAVDLRDFDSQSLRRACAQALGPVDAVLYVAGVSMMERDPESLDDADIDALAAVNFTSGVKAVNCFLDDLARSPNANCVGIGSAAQARPRGRNTVYAAAKSGLEFYFLGLRQKLAASGCKVQFYRVGFMDTQMSFGRRAWLPKASPADLAVRIRRGLGKDIGAAYLPGWWRWIAAAYGLIPWFVFKRLENAAAASPRRSPSWTIR